MIVAEFVQGIGKEAQEGMEKSLVDGFREVFGVEVKRGMITGEQREVELI